MKKIQNTTRPLKKIPIISLALIIGIFLLSRIYLAFWYQAPGSDVPNYGMDALEFREALREGTSMYEYHQKMAFARARSLGIVVPTLQEQIIEYPPVAVLWMALPVYFVGGNDQLDEITPEALQKWTVIFKDWYLVFDILIFAMLLFLFFKPAKFIKVELMGLSLYVILGIFLFNFLYDRQDLMLGGIICLTLILLFSRLHWSFAYFLLAWGVSFKLIPLLLIPVILIGSLPVEHYKSLSNYKEFINPKFLKALLIRLGFLTVMVFLLHIPFLIRDGKSAFDFIKFHSERGLQLESTYSSIIMVLALLGLPARVTHGFGAYNIDSPIAPFFIVISTMLTLLFLLGILFVLIYSIKRYFSQIKPRDQINNKSLNLAQALPQPFLYAVIASLLASIVSAKVLSPQYLLWLIPLFPLLSYGNKKIKIAGALFTAACLFTTPIFPYLYFTDFVHNQIQLADQNTFWAVPTIKATFVLFFRNMLLLATTIILIHLIFSAVSSKTGSNKS